MLANLLFASAFLVPVNYLLVPRSFFICFCKSCIQGEARKKQSEKSKFLRPTFPSNIASREKGAKERRSKEKIHAAGNFRRKTFRPRWGEAIIGWTIFIKSDFMLSYIALDGARWACLASGWVDTHLLIFGGRLILMWFEFRSHSY